MPKILVLLVGAVMTWGLLANFGFMSIVVCFALALGTLLFSNEPADDEVTADYSQMENQLAPLSTFMGGL